jgi:hypothetical protein
MVRRQIAAALIAALVGSVPLNVLAQQATTLTLSGTAKNEARKPYPDYSARARDVLRGQIVDSTPLDHEGKFSLFNNLQPTSYIVELVDPRGRVVCTDGPFDMTHQTAKNDVVIDCDRVPAFWLLLAAAAAAGITSGVVTAPPASPAR